LAATALQVTQDHAKLHCPSAGTAESQMPSPSELGDRQSSHPVKTLLQYYGKCLEALPGVGYPGFRDNRSTLYTKTGFKKNYLM